MSKPRCPGPFFPRVRSEIIRSWWPGPNQPGIALRLDHKRTVDKISNIFSKTGAKNRVGGGERAHRGGGGGGRPGGRGGGRPVNWAIGYGKICAMASLLHFPEPSQPEGADSATPPHYIDAGLILIVRQRYNACNRHSRRSEAETFRNVYTGRDERFTPSRKTQHTYRRRDDQWKEDKRPKANKDKT